jgi:hypothetical protein
MIVNYLILLFIILSWFYNLICVCTYISLLINLVRLSNKEHVIVHQYTAGFNIITILIFVAVNIRLKITRTNITIWWWCTQHKLIISTKWWFALYDSFSVFTGICKYQVNNTTDKYILNILEHNHLQNTMFTLLRIFITF